MGILGTRIKQLREELELSQADLAKALGYSDRSTIAKIEKGVNDITQSKIAAFAEALNTTPAYLMGWTTDPYDYEMDPDSRFAEIPSAQYKRLDRVYNHDLATMWKAWCKMQDDTAEEAARESAENRHAALPSDAIPLDLSNYHRIPILGRISAGLPLYADEHIEGYTITDLNGGAEYFALRVHGDSMNAIGINDGYIIIVRRQDEVEQGEIAVVMVDEEDATVKRFYSSDTTVTLMPQSTNPEHKPQMYDRSKTSIRVLGKVKKVEFSL